MLSIIVPVYNEEATVERLLGAVAALDIDKELIVVDDGSTDESLEIIKRIAPEVGAHIIVHDRNRGKGAALRSGFEVATGSHVVCQDADLELDPADLVPLYGHALEGPRPAVYGSRFLDSQARGRLSFYLGAKATTWFAMLLYGQRITDQPCCYKLIRRDLLEQLDLRCTGFEFCPEVTAKLSRLGIRIAEIPVSYRPRSGVDGKKIRWRDGLLALWTLLRYRFWRPASRVATA